MERFWTFGVTTLAVSVWARHGLAFGLMVISGGIGSPVPFFISLAILVLYRDWRVLMTASAAGAACAFRLPWFWTLEFGGGIAAFDALLIHLCFRAERELSEKLAAQAKLHSLQRMDSLGKLAGGIAHDFNNILSSILGYASFLRELKGEDDPELGKMLATIEGSAVRGSEFTRKLLVFARKGKFEKRPLSLDPCFQEVRDQLATSVGDRVSLTISADTGLWGIDADPAHFRQAVLNLALNASEAMEEGGTLRILAGNLVADEAVCRRYPSLTPGRWVHIQVADTGRGIAPENLSRVFEPFYTTKTGVRGSGMGLSLVYGIVRSHDGVIALVSEPGRGTTAHLFFPPVEVPAEGERIIVGSRNAA